MFRTVFAVLFAFIGLTPIAWAVTPAEVLLVAMMAPDTRIYAVARYRSPNKGETAVFVYKGMRYAVRANGAMSHQNQRPGMLAINMRPVNDRSGSRFELRDENLDGQIDNRGGDKEFQQMEFDTAIAMLLEYRRLYLNGR